MKSTVFFWGCTGPGSQDATSAICPWPWCSRWELAFALCQQKKLISKQRFFKVRIGRVNVRWMSCYREIPWVTIPNYPHKFINLGWFPCSGPCVSKWIPTKSLMRFLYGGKNGQLTCCVQWFVGMWFQTRKMNMRCAANTQKMKDYISRMHICVYVYTCLCTLNNGNNWAQNKLSLMWDPLHFEQRHKSHIPKPRITHTHTESQSQWH